MKKLLSFMMVAAIIMGLSSAAISKDFSGVITYKISYPGMEVDASMAAMLPKLATLYIKGDKSKLEINLGQMGSQATITDGEAQMVISLMDIPMMGGKFYFEETFENVKAEATEEGADISVEVQDETKEIAGYTCKKALVTVKESGSEMVFTTYFTDEIGSSSLNANNPYFKDINGAMLEFEMDMGQGMRMKMEAISVDKKKVADSEFEVPEGYVKKTAEEMQQMGGGM
jgi:GLPGLI family protein